MSCLQTPSACTLAEQVSSRLGRTALNSQAKAVNDLLQLVARTGNDGTVILLCCILDEVSSQNKRSGVPPLLTEFLRSQLPAASLSTVLSRAHELTRRKELLLSAVRSFSQNPQELFWLATACLEASPDPLRDLGAELGNLAWAQRSKLEPAHQLSLVASLRAAGVAVDASSPQPLALVHVGGLTLNLDSLLAEPPAQLVDILPIANQSAGKQAMDTALNGMSSLAGVMEEMGYRATADESAVKALMTQFPTITAEDMARVLCMMARTRTGLQSSQSIVQASLSAAFSNLGLGSGPPPETWNPRLFIDCVQGKHGRHVDWQQIPFHLDHSEFSLPDFEAFKLLVESIRLAFIERFPLDALLGGVWRNAEGQLAMLRHATAAPQSVFTFARAKDKLPHLDSLAGRDLGSNQAWSCVDVYTALSRLADVGHLEGVTNILKGPLTACPELVLLGLAAAAPHSDRRILQTRIAQPLALRFAAQAAQGSPASQALMHQLRDINGEMLVSTISEFYDDPRNRPGVVDLCQKLGMLPEMLAEQPFHLDLHVLAAQRGHLRLNDWLLEQRSGPNKDALVQALLRYLEDKVVAGQGPLPPMPILKLLLSMITTPPASIPRDSKEDQDTLHRIVVRFAALVKGEQAEAGGAPAAPPSSFPPEVEDEANAHFQRVYAGAESLEDLMQIMSRSAKSTVASEKQLFACMLANLLDEARFFSKYPPEELLRTGAIFGLLVDQNLVQGQVMALILREITEGLQHGPDSKLFSFGLEALGRFRDRLSTWPELCRLLLNIPNFVQHGKDLVEVARAGMPTVNGVASPSEGSQQQSRASSVDLPAPSQQEPPRAAAGVGTQQVSASAGPSTADQQVSMPASATGASGISSMPDGRSSSPVARTHNEPEAEPLVPALAEDASLTTTAAAPGPHSIAPEETGPTVLQPAGHDDQAQGIRLVDGAGISPLGVGGPPAVLDPNRAFQAISVATLEAAAADMHYPVPSEQSVNRVKFIMNNLSVTNCEHKKTELDAVLSDEHWPWFADYLVVTRAAQEPNFHDLYLKLLQMLDRKRVWDLLTSTTYTYVRILLESERIKTVAGERSLLRNLGSWLGRLTIQRNKMVLFKQLDLKSILYQAYQQGKMIAVLPFFRNVLEPCKDSRVFRPPNPWLMAILSLIAEIYALPKLKLNLKFEIETVFRSMNLQISDVKASDTLRAYTRQVEGNADFAVDKAAPSPAAALMPTPALLPGLTPLAPPTSAPAPAATPRQPSGPPPPLPPPEPAPAAAPGTPPSTAGPPRSAPLDSEAARALVAAGPAATGAAAPDAAAAISIQQHISISANLGMLADRLPLPKLVSLAMERTIAEIITPVVERSVTIACMTTQELILKDWATESEEQRMQAAAHLMVSSLAGSLAVVSCKEPLKLSLAVHLRSLLAQTQQMDPQTVEHAANALTSDNLDLGCSIIEKAAGDKGIRDIDERLAQAYQGRVRAKQTRQTFLDNVKVQEAGRFHLAIPESLRPKMGHLSPSQQRVYEDFARIPRNPMAAAKQVDQATAAAAFEGRAIPDEAAQALHQLQERFAAWQSRVETLAAKEPQMAWSALPADSELPSLVKSVTEVTGTQEEHVLRVGRFLFARLFEGVHGRLFVTTFVAAMAVLRDKVLQQLPIELTNSWISIVDERKFNSDVAEAMIQAEMFHVPDLDQFLAKTLSTTSRLANSRAAGIAIEFSQQLVRACLVDGRLLAPADLSATLDMLDAIGSSNLGMQRLNSIVAQARQPRRLQPAAGQPTGPVDPPGLRDQVLQLFGEWCMLVEDQPAERAHRDFVARLQQAGFLKGDELTDRFLHICVEHVVAHCQGEGASPAPQRPGLLQYSRVDAFVRLICTLISSHGGGAPLLGRALGTIAANLQRTADVLGEAFTSKPFFRIFIGFIAQLSPLDAADQLGFSMLTTLGATFFQLQPLRVPHFAFSWLELVSHRQFMPKLLQVPGHQGWPHFQRLLVALLRLLEPYLRNAELTEAVRFLYKGTLRVLLVLLHDFPEFLCEYHFPLCDVVPPSCIQMRNLILSAFPRNMRLPDPFTPNLKVDLLPEISQAPRFLPQPSQLLPPALRSEVDTFLHSRSNQSFLVQLPARLQLPAQEAMLCGTRYNVPLLNALVFYVGIQGIVQQQSKIGPNQPVAPTMGSSPMDIFKRLVTELDTEGRYLFLNALANQLRYPNNHTHYFSCVLLFLFAETGSSSNQGRPRSEVIQEQITRVLLERLIVNRPHPWGLLITFIELIKNPRYDFWGYGFTHCATEIERLFESVARSCMGNKPEIDGMQPAIADDNPLAVS